MIKVLVTNDDGIEAAGIKALVKAISSFARVYVAAPESQRSGKSQSITIRGEMTCKETIVPGAEKAFALSGTPADCVKYGVQKLCDMGIAPDYVISGINMGANCGIDVNYSGTVGAAMEGAYSGIRSIALSVGNHEATHFEYICDMIPELLKLSDEFSPETVINVNAPDVPKWEVKGVKIVSTGEKVYDDEITDLENFDGKYSYTGTCIEPKGSREHYDNAALQAGYATITPLITDRTDKVAIRKMKRMTVDNTILVMVDFQEKIIPAMHGAEKMAENVIKLARCAKRIGLPIMVTQQYTKGLGGTAPELKNVLGSFERIEKLEFDCTDNSEFTERLAASKSKNVIICGIESHICLQYTALSLLESGYNVTVLRDCSASRKRECMETAFDLMANRGCTVTTYESVIYKILGSSVHDAFRAISAIVKE